MAILLGIRALSQAISELCKSIGNSIHSPESSVLAREIISSTVKKPLFVKHFYYLSFNLFQVQKKTFL
jgi:hypothetical protein